MSPKIIDLDLLCFDTKVRFLAVFLIFFAKTKTTHSSLDVLIKKITDRPKKMDKISIGLI